MARFEGKAALITGGALGIGGATARRLAAEGASVLIADIDDDAAAANVARITDAGGIAVAAHIDVSSSEDCRRMVDETVDAFGRLDILVQNAFSVISGESRIHGDAISVEEADWDYGIDVLVKALYLGAKHAVPRMRAVGGGAIINLASVHSLLPRNGHVGLRNRQGCGGWLDASTGSSVRTGWHPCQRDRPWSHSRRRAR